MLSCLKDTFVIFWEGGGRSSKDYIGSQGEGGALGSPKKDDIIFSWSLTVVALAQAEN